MFCLIRSVIPLCLGRRSDVTVTPTNRMSDTGCPEKRTYNAMSVIGRVFVAVQSKSDEIELSLSNTSVETFHHITCPVAQ